MHNIKRIALTVYYWPPTGGSGVQRWLFLANHFATQGMDVTVFVPQNPRVAQQDFELESKIHPTINIVRVAGWEPFQQTKKPIGENMGNNKGIIKRFVRWVRANFFIPDARVYWANAAVDVFLTHHKQKPFDVLITSGPPHSLHRVGLMAKQKANLLWVADFRDPWTGFFQNHSLPMTRSTKKKHIALEQKVLQQADHVVVTAPSLKEDFATFTSKISLLTNGYEKLLPIPKNRTKGLVYTGSLKVQQNPTHLWLAIAELIASDADFKAAFSLEIYGNVASSIKDEIHALGIDTHVTFLGYQPKSVIDERLSTAKALLLLGINMPMTQNVIHGKLFEYMAAQRPVLGIGPKPSDMEPLFNEHDLGVYASFTDKVLLKKTLLEWFSKDAISNKTSGIDIYARTRIAEAYLTLIRSLS